MKHFKKMSSKDPTEYDTATSDFDSRKIDHSVNEDLYVPFSLEELTAQRKKLKKENQWD